MRRLVLLVLLLIAVATAAWLLLSPGRVDGEADADLLRAGVDAPLRNGADADTPSLVGRRPASAVPGEQANGKEECQVQTCDFLVVTADDEARPIPGARVELYDKAHEVLASGTTDAQGEVGLSVSGDADFYRVSAVAEGYGRRRAIWLRRRHRSEVQTLRLPVALVFRGTVIDADDGVPVTGATIRLTSAESSYSSNDPRWWIQEEAATVTTGPDGAFRFENGARDAGVGQNVFVVDAEGYAHVEKMVFDVDCLLGEGLEILVPRAGRIAGRVLGPDGAPAVSATVLAAIGGQAWLIRENEDIRLPGTPMPCGFFGEEPDPVVDLWRAAWLETDEEGRFSFLDLAAGETYLLEARLGDLPTSERVSVVATVAGGDAELRILEPGKVVVRVRSPDGHALPDVGLRLERHPSLERLDEVLEHRGAATDADGIATFEDLRPGVIHVETRTPPPVSEIRSLGSGATEEVVLIVEPVVEEPDPAPEPTAQVSGRVVDDTGKPVKGVRVSLYRGSGQACTAEDGTFRIDGVCPGKERLRVRTTGTGVTRFFIDPFLDPIHIHVPAEGVEIVVNRPVILRGTLALPQGVGAPTYCGLEYESRGWARRTRCPWQTGERTLSFEGTCASDVETVTVTPKGFLPVIWKVSVEPGQEVVLPSRVLDPGLSLEGRVLDGLGRPVRGARVRAWQGRRVAGNWIDELTREARTDEDGAFGLTAMRAAVAKVSIETEWTFNDLEREIEVASDLEPLVFRLPVPGTLACRVVDRTGAPVARKDVRVTSLDVSDDDRDVSHYLPTTDIAGRIRIAIVAGRYLVEVRRSGAWNEPHEIRVSEKAVVPPDGEVEVRLVIDRK